MGGQAKSDAINTLAAGPHTVTAVYSGSDQYDGSTSPGYPDCRPGALFVTASDSSKVYGQPNPAFIAQL